MKCVVYLDRQHSGKPGRKAKDRGAGADLDGDGSIGIEEREAMLTARYGLACETALLEMGHTVIPISDGWYSDRHRRVNEYAGTFPRGTPQVMVAMHLNAGGGDYGAVFFDHRSRTGPELAARIAKQVRMVAPEVNGVKTIAAKPDDWTRAAFGTIGGIMQPVALCFEPCFMDNPAHADLLTREGLASIGRALAAGIDAWATTCEV
jgi:N-acetylmuramoyl-L-alanine amidase